MISYELGHCAMCAVASKELAHRKYTYIWPGLQHT